jgi:hypothetical protein
MDQYQNLQQLLVNSVDAENYYRKLPDYVRDELASRSEQVHSMQGMRMTVHQILSPYSADEF